MKRLIIECLKDTPSKNIVASLVSEGGWEDMGSDGEYSYRRKGDDVILSLPGLHIRTNDLDKRAAEFGFTPDVVIFPSEHASTSGMPALTVHPMGNFNGNDLGGNERELATPCPAMMTDCLRMIKERCTLPEFNICFEATHHGPFVDTPSFFIEIGSDENYWPRKDAAELLASVIRDVPETNDYPAVVGFGGGHYAPRFTELALSYKVNFAHMLPNYQWMGHDDEDIARMIKLAIDRSGTKLSFIHRKSMKGMEAQKLRELGESVGAEWVDWKDWEPLTGNR